MRLYRICTEGGADNERRALEIVALEFPGFTVLRGTGYWKGTCEYALVIEITATFDEEQMVREVADRIRRINKQEAVLIQTLTCEVELCTD